MDGCRTLYLKHLTEQLRELVEFCIKHDTMFRSERGNALTRAASATMTTKYLPTCYEVVKMVVKGAGRSGSLGIENSDGNEESVVSFIPLSAHRTVTTIERTALGIYPMQTALLNMFFRRWK